MKKIITCIVAACMLLTACDTFSGEDVMAELSSTPAASTAVLEETPVNTAPVYGGGLTLSMRTPKTLNPILNEDASVDRILKLIFRPLFNIDEEHKIKPDLARSYQLSSDGLNAVITLRSDITWSDGTDVTANDFKFTIDEIMNAPEESIYKSSVTNIASCVVVDSRTVRLEFIQHYSGMEYLFTFPLIPEHYYKNQRNPSSEKNMNPLGNGSYEFVSYKLVEEMQLTAAKTSKRPYIDNITVMITPDAETDLYAFDQNVIDVAPTNLATWSKYRSVKEASVYEYTTSYYDFIGFNFENKALQNKSVREAVAAAVDLDFIMSNVYLDQGVKASTPVNPVSWFYDPQVVPHTFDLKNAGALLRRSGEDLRLRILVNQENAERVKIAEILSENLIEAGVSVTVESVDFEEYVQKIEDKDFDLFVGGLNLSVFPDLTFAFHSSNIGGSNLFSYSNPEMDSLLTNVFVAIGEVPLLSALSELQKYISEEVVCVSLCFRDSVLLTDENIYGGVAPYINNIYHNIDEWYIIR